MFVALIPVLEVALAPGKEKSFVEESVGDAYASVFENENDDCSKHIQRIAVLALVYGSASVAEDSLWFPHSEKQMPSGYSV